MQRPGKATSDDLKQPLLPRDDDDIKSEHQQQRRIHKSYGPFLFGISRMLAAILTVDLFWKFMKDETVYLMPGEWVVLSLSLLMLLQTNLTSYRIRADSLWPPYAVFLVCLRFLIPMPLGYYLLVMALLFQTVSLGLEMTLFLRAEEEMNRKKVDDDDALGLPSGPNTHWGVACDECNACPIVGTRYRARQTSNNYDVCESCMAKMPSAVRTENYVAIQNPLPLSDETLDLLRKEEAYMRKQIKEQKESDAREALLLASVDPKTASALNVV